MKVAVTGGWTLRWPPAACRGCSPRHGATRSGYLWEQTKRWRPAGRNPDSMRPACTLNYSLFMFWCSEPLDWKPEPPSGQKVSVTWILERQPFLQMENSGEFLHSLCDGHQSLYPGLHTWRFHWFGVVKVIVKDSCDVVLNEEFLPAWFCGSHPEDPAEKKRDGWDLKSFPRLVPLRPTEHKQNQELGTGRWPRRMNQTQTEVI